MKRLLFTIALCVLPITASADIVTMNDGRVLRGSVESEGQDLIIKGRYGSLRVKKANVKDWQFASPEEKAFAKKKAQLGNGNADERYRLGVFARDKGLHSKAKAAFESVLLVNPNHPGARSALGYVKHQGLWMTVADKARMEGKVKYRGRWVTLDEKAELIKKARQEKEAQEKAKIENFARKKLRRNLLRGASREDNGRTYSRPVPSYDPNPDRYSVLDNYYGPFLPGPASGYRFVSGTNGVAGFLGSRRFPLYRGIPLGRTLSYQDQLLLAAARRQGRPIPAHLRGSLGVIQSPGFGRTQGTRRGYGFRNRGTQRSGFNLGVNGTFSGGRGRFGVNVGASTTRGRSSSRSGFSGSYLRRNVGTSFSGSHQSRSGRRRISFRFRP
ncbi:MAG: hypothetical protein P1V97_25455 [Planctomycetota bacterium]|nr:hypothetical protein [Planctomycetota bacterium]